MAVEDRPAIRSGRIEVRVRYCECDPMSVAHHSAFPVWLEMGRTELCRADGISYRELEEEGVLLAVTALSVRYRSPARYDDLLTIETNLVRTTRVKLEHAYRVLRGDRLVATAETTVACIGPDGRPRLLPEGVVPDAPAGVVKE